MMPRRPPQRRSKLYLLLPTLFVFIALAVSAAYWAYQYGLRPAAASGPAQRFVVRPGESAPTVATHLKKQGLIRHRDAFITYLNLHGLRTRLQAGTYSLEPTLSGQAIADILVRGRTMSDHLVIPEGYRLAQIRELAIGQGISGKDFDAALQATHNHPFLASKPPKANLEGYLFPDSYRVNSATTAKILVGAMLDTFGKRVGPEYVQAFAAQGLNLHQALTIASLVEREVSIESDRPIVAQIFLKRHRIGMPLGSDSSVQYIADQSGTPFNLDVNSPYNTRKFAGLPPGPIGSPGLSALNAVAHPAHTDYLYFLSGNDGKTYFAKTYAEHERNIAKYLR